MLNKALIFSGALLLATPAIGQTIDETVCFGMADLAVLSLAEQQLGGDMNEWARHLWDIGAKDFTLPRQEFLAEVIKATWDLDLVTSEEHFIDLAEAIQTIVFDECMTAAKEIPGW